ncbi:MAG: dihydrofolate reductase [archaeon]|nr:dihydrofolate reductase [archaeon]
MDLVLIAAVSINNVIGINGQMPWRIPEDLTRFKELTLGHPVIMGRNTYESIPNKFRPLQGRHNIVMTSNPDFRDNGIYIAHSLEEALAEADKAPLIGENPPLVYIIGGETVYRDTMPLATKLEITHVKRVVTDGDAFFPPINHHEWQGVPVDYGETEFNKDGIPIEKEYSFVTYTKTRR